MYRIYLGNEQRQRFKQFFRRLEIPANTIILREGEIAEQAYYIESGCLRSCVITEDKDITFEFFFENEIASIIESFETCNPSSFTLESIEHCIIHTISREDFKTLIATLRELEVPRKVDGYIFRALMHYQNLLLSRIKDSPKKRYLKLLKHYPKIWEGCLNIISPPT